MLLKPQSIPRRPSGEEMLMPCLLQTASQLDGPVQDQLVQRWTSSRAEAGEAGASSAATVARARAKVTTDERFMFASLTSPAALPHRFRWVIVD